jgi:hypothetical protein
MVNRHWKWHFGEGIVRSVDNFGRLGERPDNQPLLDYLAVHFIESGWSMKAMQRLIVLSSAYQMASRNSKFTIENPTLTDPENRLLSHRNRRRLDAEEIRDALLTVSGQIDLKMGGPVLPPEVNIERVRDSENVISRAYQSSRRSIYVPVIRSGLYDLFQAFDFADTSIVTGRRDTTTVAPQALFLMNSDLVWQASQRLAERVFQSNANDESRLREVYELAYGRPPTSKETARALEFLGTYENELEKDGLGIAERRRCAWQAWCRVILASNEFIYVE